MKAIRTRSRAVVIGIGTVALVLAACASSPSSSTSTAPRVHVVVSADDSVRRMVNTDKLKNVTEEALREYAPDAGEATVTIRFNSLGTANVLPPGVAIVPLAEGSTAMQRPVVEGTYTITDAGGGILEQRPIAIPPDYRDGFTDRLDAQRAVAADVAKRVAALRPR